MLRTNSGKSLESKARQSQSQKMKFFNILLFNNKENKKEEKANLLKQAANKYFIEKKIDDAIRCLKESTNLYYELDSSMGNSNFNLKQNTKLLITYYKALDKYDSNELIKWYSFLAEIYSVDNDFTNFNEQYLEIAKILEKNNELEKALKYLNKCIGNDVLLHKRILEKKSDLLIKMKQYKEASNSYKLCCQQHIEKNETVGTIYAKPSFFMSMICIMATKNLSDINNQLSDLLKFDETLINSTEGMFISRIINSLNMDNIDEFEEACKMYELSKKFTTTQMTMLLLAKEIISGKTNNNQYDSDDTNNSYNSYNSEECNIDIC